MDSSTIALILALEEEHRINETHVNHTRPQFHIYSMRLNNDSHVIIDAHGPGALHEATIRFNGNSLHVRLNVDGQVIEGDFDEYQKYSAMTNAIDAFEDNGDKIIRIARIPFSDKLYLSVRGNGTARIVARWDETPK